MGQLVDLSGAVLQRSIKAPNITFKEYLTIEEDPTDDTEITRHPVDSGAIMSDHIILMPPELKLRLGWSNSDMGSTGPSYVRNTYSQLLTLKNNRQLFTVYTGKRFYTNMFVRSLRGPVTDARHEWSMIVDILLQQVLLVDLASASSAPTAVNAAANPNPQNVASPQNNQQTKNVGFNQLRTGNGPTEIPSGENPGAPTSGGFATLQTGDGPTQIPAGVPNGNDGGAGPSPYGDAAISGQTVVTP